MRVALAALSLALAGCGLVPSNVVAKKDRAVDAAPEAIRWAGATRADVIGRFESDSISGDAAGSLRKIEYLFEADGSYSGAALVQEGARSTFQTLAGRWALENGAMRLGDDPPAKAEAAPGRLRLSAPGGVVTFKRPSGG